jgi:hypothetical protein
MRKIGRYEVHPGNRPGERRVYSRSTEGNLERLGANMERAMLLRFDIHTSKQVRNRMKRTFTFERKKFIFFAIAAVVLIVALTVNFPSF